MTHSTLAPPPAKSHQSKRLVSLSRYSLMVTLISAGLTMGLTGCTTVHTQAPHTQAPYTQAPIGRSSTGYGVPATDRTLAQRILDQSIVNTARANINAIEPTLHQRSRIGLDSFYSNVLLTGEVPDAATKEQVVNIVSSMPDVKQVYDRLSVGAQKGTSYTVHDGYITAKIAAKIVASDTIKSSQVKVVTDDGVVYVLGKLTPTQRGHLINVVETTVGVKELIILTDLIDDNGALIAESSVTQEVGLEPPDANALVSSEAPFAEAGSVAETGAVTETGTDSKAAAVAALPTTIATIPTTISTIPTSIATKVASAPSTSTVVPAPTPGTAQPSTSPSSPSGYIEMYKHEVPGWQ